MAKTAFAVTVIGEENIVRRMTNLQKRAMRAKPAMELVAAELFNYEDKLFNSEGRYQGGSWEYISDDWVARKLARGLDPRIMHATLALRDAMSIPGAPHQDFKVTNRDVILGTDLKYAHPADAKRPFSHIKPPTRRKMGFIIREWIAEAMHQ
jgi:hypothetical protein